MMKAQLARSSRLSRMIVPCAAILYFAGPFAATKADPPTNTAVYAWTMSNIDVDALAARQKNYQDLYPKIRDQALAAYAQLHPTAHPYDDDAKKFIKLTTYLWLWGDIYRENLWTVAWRTAQHAKDSGATDPILDLLADWNADATQSDFHAADLCGRADKFAATSYPDELKGWYYQIAITKLNRAQADSARAALPDLIQKWGQIYGNEIKKPLPNSLLYNVGDALQSEVQDDDDTLTRVNKQADQTFAAVAPTNPVQQELDGSYWTDEAWIARGSGWANSVTDDQWKRFRDDLDKAENVLVDAFANHPEESDISLVMLKVELGQGKGRDRMEKWFQHAIQADPQNGEAYSAKFWYLQPRWYGTENDLVEFGEQCMADPNAPPTALTAFAVAMSQASDQHPDIYKEPEVWTQVEKNYRQFLTQFPQSIFFRTSFAKHAADSGHWAVAREQFKLLGDNWDRSVMSADQHASYMLRASSGTPTENSTESQNDGQVTPYSLLEGFVYWLLRVFRA